MILNSATAISMVVPRRPLWRPICCASPIVKTEQLRSELDQLHAEAETARTSGTHISLSLLFLFVFLMLQFRNRFNWQGFFLFFFSPLENLFQVETGLPVRCIGQSNELCDIEREELNFVHSPYFNCEKIELWYKMVCVYLLLMASR